MTVSDLVTSVDLDRREGNLSSCLRLYVLDFYRAKLMRLTSAPDALAESLEIHSATST